MYIFFKIYFLYIIQPVFGLFFTLRSGLGVFFMKKDLFLHYFEIK